MWIEGDATERECLAAAADIAAKNSGLHFTLRHRAVRWPWARQKPAIVYISAGGCACSLLSDDADSDDEYWALEPKAAEQLGTGLEIFALHGPGRVSFQALWLGERVDRDVTIDPAALAALIRAKGTGVKVRYILDRRANNDMQLTKPR